MLRCALLLAALLLAAPALATPRNLLADPVETISGKAIVISEERKGAPPRNLLGVHTSDGKRLQIQLSDDSQVAGLHTGMHISVTGRWEQRAAASAAAAGGAAPAVPRFTAASIRASGASFAAPKVTVVGGTGSVAAAAAGPPIMPTVLSTNQLSTPQVNTIVIPIAGMQAPGVPCQGTGLPLYTQEQVRKAVLAEANPKGVTVGSTFNKCSMGVSKLTAYNSKVEPLVQLPCRGTSKGTPWSFSKCDFGDFSGYADAADAAIRARGVDLSKYKYKVYLLPPGPCTMVGLGYVGCDAAGADCRSWIGADWWATPAAMVHEIGHNLFMGHAGAVENGEYDEYADMSGTMGYCCSDRCPNTPHAWQLGWISVQQLDGTSLRAGQTLTTTLSSQSTAFRSGLRITPGWVAGVDPVFVGYRTKAGGDVASAADTAGKVHIYSAAITNTFDSAQTTWQAALRTPGRAWAHRRAGLVVRLKAVTARGAVVSVCRKGGAETLATCRAGQDNDCNGLVGIADPACSLLMKRAAVKPAAKPAAKP